MYDLLGLVEMIHGLSEKSSNEKKYSEDYNDNKEETIKEFEINFIKKHLKIHKGNVAATAKAINFHPVSLRQKISKLGIDPRDYKY